MTNTRTAPGARTASGPRTASRTRTARGARTASSGPAGAARAPQAAPGARAPRAAGRTAHGAASPVVVERVQTGIRIEKRILKTVKALAEYLDLSVGDLIEGVLLHAFENKTPFGKNTLEQIPRIKAIYGLDLTAADSHHLREPEPR